jgi:hypothetical protein
MSRAHGQRGKNGQCPQGGAPGPAAVGSPKRPEDTPKHIRLVRGNIDASVEELHSSLDGEPRLTILGPWRYRNFSTWFEHSDDEDEPPVRVESCEEVSGSDDSST